MREAYEQAPKSSKSWWHFFALTLLFSWLMWFPGYLVSKGILDSSSVFVSISNAGKWIGGLGPSIAAIFLVARDKGWQGVKKLLGRVFHFRMGYWYFPAIFIVPAAVVFAHLITKMTGGTIPSTGSLTNPHMIPLLFFVFLVMVASEEYGWRGYALEALQERRSALASSLIIGGFWVLWHLPMFVIEGFGLNSNGIPFVQYAITLMCISVLITWLQNNTGQSLVPAFILHALINLTGEVLPLHKGTSGALGLNAWFYANTILIICTVVVVKGWGAKTLTRSSITSHAHAAAKYYLANEN